MIRFASLAALFCLSASTVFAHCQVPCGIYGDQLRFEQMLEDEHTISKAQLQLHDLADDPSVQDINQMARWVMTKEQHAQQIQDTIAAYFMAQRIKPGADNYDKSLKAAHKVMIAAMKCKQSADADTAKALEDAIFDFYRAYEGKEPTFEHTH